MRIPNLNVTQSVTQRIRDLDLQRFKLDEQISTGQKIKYAEDDGSMMSRTIRLDSQKANFLNTNEMRPMPLSLSTLAYES